MASTNLGITDVVESQNGKEVTINEGFEALDTAYNSTVSVASSGDVTLTSTQYTRNFKVLVTGTPGAPFDLFVPSSTSRFFLVDNQSDGEASVQVVGGAGVSVEVPASEARLLYCDGTDVQSVGGGDATSGPAPYDIRLGFISTPTSDQVIDTILLPRVVTLPADMAGSLGAVASGDEPTSSFELSLQDDAVEIGTITISTGGSFTFATTSGTEKIIASGSVLTLVAPTTVDATVANVVMTLLGSA